MYKYVLSFIICTLMLLVSVFLNRIANNKEFPLIFQGEISKKMAERKHHNSTHFSSNIAALNKNDLQDSLILYCTKNINEVFSCLKDSSCSNEKYIYPGSQNLIEEELLNFKSKLLDLDNCIEVDYENTFKYYLFLNTLFKADSVNIVNVDDQYSATVLFPIETNKEVRFDFVREDETFYLKSVFGLCSFFRTAEKIVIEDNGFLPSS